MKKLIILSILFLFVANLVNAQVGYTATNPKLVSVSQVISVMGQAADTINNATTKSYFAYVNPYAGTVKFQVKATKLTGTNHGFKAILMSSMDGQNWTRLDSTATQSSTTTTPVYLTSGTVTTTAPYIRVYTIGTVSGMTSRLNYVILYEKKQ